jgi:cation transport ATPase
MGSPYGQPTGLGPRYGWQARPEQDGTGQPGDQQGGWRPASQAPQRPASQRQAQRQARPPERELRQRAIASLVFGAIALVALLGLGTDLHRGIYLLIFSAAVGVAALVIGITALFKARKTGSFRPRGAVGGIVLGALATFIAVTILATYLAFPTQVSNYINCLRQAQKSSDQQACMTKFYKSIRLGAIPAPGASATAARTGHSGASGSPARLPTGR